MIDKRWDLWELHGVFTIGTEDGEEKVIEALYDRKLAEHIVETHNHSLTLVWAPSRWWRLLDKDGKLKAETSNPEEIVRFHEEGDIVERLFRTEADEQWQKTTLRSRYSIEEIAKIKKDWAEFEKEMGD